METIKDELEKFAEKCRSGSTKKWAGGILKASDLRGASLGGANLEGAYLVGAYLEDTCLDGANLRGANLECADLIRTQLRDASLKGADLECADLRVADLYGADLTGAKLWGADFGGATLEDSIGFRFEDTPDPQELRYKIANLIESSPELHDQERWGFGEPNECNTPCCVAGWACRLGGGTRGYRTEDAATRLLHVDGKVMPSFWGGAEREDILEALRS